MLSLLLRAHLLLLRVLKRPHLLAERLLLLAHLLLKGSHLLLLLLLGRCILLLGRLHLCPHGKVNTRSTQSDADDEIEKINEFHSYCLMIVQCKGTKKILMFKFREL